MSSNIRILPLHIINQIAAGEVIERPSAIVKELIENSIDASATEIIVTLSENLISIQDNGIGMTQDDIALCISKHATSKLYDDDLSAISTLGFRGEAISSIASVANMEIITKSQNNEPAIRALIKHGKIESVTYAAANKGTIFSITNLFSDIPARKKFLKSSAIENNKSKEVFERLALGHSNISFVLKINEKNVYNLPKSSYDQRIFDIIGYDFSHNCKEFKANTDYFSMWGLCSLPTLNKSTPRDQYIFLNNRPIRDKNILFSIRAGYGDLLPKERYPSFVLFIDMLPSQFDINVHPAKVEARFLNPMQIKDCIILAITEALKFSTTSNTILNDLRSIKNTHNTNNISLYDSSLSSMKRYTAYQRTIEDMPMTYDNESHSAPIGNERMLGVEEHKRCSLSYIQNDPLAISQALSEMQLYEKMSSNVSDNIDTKICKVNDLGIAMFMFETRYIIAHSKDHITIIDAHAAHERILYEKLKMSQIDSQVLIEPIVMQHSLSDELIDLFTATGVICERFGDNMIIITAMPSLLKNKNPQEIFHNIMFRVNEGTNNTMDDLYSIYSSCACHNSFRSGKTMSMYEMNELIRQIEQSPYAAQCNHGRPTFIKLSKKKLDYLFERA